MLQLRDYQAQGVDAIRQEYKQGKKAVLYVLPTGGGKTVVFSHIAGTTAGRGKRAAVLVHRIELMRQTSKALMKSDVHHGLINPKFTANYSAQVQVASVQTLVNRLAKLTKAPDLLIIDEAHHATASTWRKIINAFPEALVLGVTATPVRSDGSGLGIDSGGIFDSLVMGPQIQELIDRGFLVKPKVYAPSKQIDFSGVKMTRGDFDKEEIEEKVDRPQITGDVVAHYKRLCDGAPAVAFCISVDHAQHVANEFRNAGYRAEAVDGEMSDDDRSRILNGLGNGTIDVVASCDLISEGTDIPAIACAILLRPTYSLALYLQQVGRALRIIAGKEGAVILDHVGNVLRHGLPEEFREWSLEGRPKKKRLRDIDDLKIKTKQCEECYLIHEPAPVCPSCGFIYEAKTRNVEQADGELEEITPEKAKALKEEKQRQARQEVGKAKTFEELEAIGQKRGYKEGWAKHVWASRNKKETPL